MAANTPLHCIRCPDELWSAAQAKAKNEGSNITAVVRAALEQYVQNDKSAPPAPWQATDGA